MSGPDTTGSRYVYAVAPAAIASTDLGQGIDRRPVETVTADGLAALVHRHGPEPYTDEDGDVERRVLEHANVVDRAWRAGPVLPVSFNVIVAPGDDETADERMRAWLDQHARRIGDRLEALRGHAELHVDISLDARAVAETDAEASAERDALALRSAGVQRLLARRRRHQDKDLADRRADELYPDHRRRLAAVSEDLIERAAPRTDQDAISVLAAAVLVPTDQVSAVGAVLSVIQDEQPAARIRFSGPWPPYSFTEIPGLDRSGDG